MTPGHMPKPFFIAILIRVQEESREEISKSSERTKNTEESYDGCMKIVREKVKALTRMKKS
jgi:hypothetical protein